METMTVGDFKANFSEVLKKVLNGEEVAISYGKRKEIVARLVPGSGEKKQKRKIGIFETNGKVVFNKNFSITEAEMVGL